MCVYCRIAFVFHVFKLEKKYSIFFGPDFCRISKYVVLPMPYEFRGKTHKEMCIVYTERAPLVQW